MNLPHVLKQLPQRHYVHVVPEIVSPSLPNVDEVFRDLRKAVSMNLKSKLVEIPIRDLFSRQDEGVKEIYELKSCSGGTNGDENRIQQTRLL